MPADWELMIFTKTHSMKIVPTFVVAKPREKRKRASLIALNSVDSTRFGAFSPALAWASDTRAPWPLQTVCNGEKSSRDWPKISDFSLVRDERENLFAQSKLHTFHKLVSHVITCTKIFLQFHYFSSENLQAVFKIFLWNFTFFFASLFASFGGPVIKLIVFCNLAAS